MDGTRRDVQQICDFYYSIYAGHAGRITRSSSFSLSAGDTECTLRNIKCEIFGRFENYCSEEQQRGRGRENTFAGRYEKHFNIAMILKYFYDDFI